MADRAASIDPIREVFRDLRLTDSRYVRSALAAPWGMRISGCGRALFHFVAEGSCVLRAGDHVGSLHHGDLVLLPHGRTHDLSDEAGSPVRGLATLEREALSDLGVQLTQGGDGARTVLISGSFLFEAHPVVAELPEVLYARRGAGADVQTGRVIEALLHEVAAPGPGSDVVVDRLADVLVIRAIRGWLDATSDSRRGWLGALRQPGLDRALARIHTEAVHPWTLSELAAEAGMSRASFAAKFTEHVGKPPIQFLSERRMQLATRWMQREELSITQVADRLGYSSAAAFSRAFKRATGRTPGAVARGG